MRGLPAIMADLNTHCVQRIHLPLGAPENVDVSLTCIVHKDKNSYGEASHLRKEHITAEAPYEVSNHDSSRYAVYSHLAIHAVRRATRAHTVYLNQPVW